MPCSRQCLQYYKQSRPGEEYAPINPLTENFSSLLSLAKCLLYFSDTVTTYFDHEMFSPTALVFRPNVSLHRYTVVEVIVVTVSYYDHISPSFSGCFVYWDTLRPMENQQKKKKKRKKKECLHVTPVLRGTNL